MNRNWYCRVIFIGLTFLVMCSTIACSSPRAQEKQQIVDYLNDMLPLMTKHADMSDEWLDFSLNQNLEYSEYLDGMEDFRRQATDIYMQIGKSIPPPPLRDFKQGWYKELQLFMQALDIAIQGVYESDLTLIREADKLIMESNTIKDEYTNDLLDVLTEYDIDIAEFSP